MAEHTAEDPAAAKRKIPVIWLAAILVLSLATYWFFNAQAMPLDKASTVIVVGIWTALVLLIRWVWNLARARRTKLPGPNSTNKEGQ